MKFLVGVVGLMMFVVGGIPVFSMLSGGSVIAQDTGGPPGSGTEDGICNLTGPTSLTSCELCEIPDSCANGVPSGGSEGCENYKMTVSTDCAGLTPMSCFRSEFHCGVLEKPDCDSQDNPICVKQIEGCKRVCG